MSRNEIELRAVRRIEKSLYHIPMCMRRTGQYDVNGRPVSYTLGLTSDIHHLLGIINDFCVSTCLAIGLHATESAAV